MAAHKHLCHVVTIPESQKKFKKTILVVDDEPKLLELYQLLLEEKGYQVLVAKSGEEALEICTKNENEIDLLITDMVMTGITGVVLAESLIKISPEIQVFYMSGYMDGFKKIKRANAQYLQKPFSNFLLLNKIQELFEIRA